MGGLRGNDTPIGDSWRASAEEAIPLPEMPYGEVDILYFCVIQAVVIANYKRTSAHEY